MLRNITHLQNRVLVHELELNYKKASYWLKRQELKIKTAFQECKDESGYE
jgi:hypothetical protein